MASTKKMMKKTMGVSSIPIESIGKKTRQGNGKRSKPKLGKKRYKGQGH